MYASDTDAIMAALLGTYAVVMVISLILSVIMIVGFWKVYTKAGQPGWASIIPFYCNYVLFDIAMGNGILFLLLFVPVVNFVMLLIVTIKLGAAFGKGGGFIAGMIFLPYIFIPMLGFGNSQYIGPQ